MHQGPKTVNLHLNRAKIKRCYIPLSVFRIDLYHSVARYLYSYTYIDWSKSTEKRPRKQMWLHFCKSGNFSLLSYFMYAESQNVSYQIFIWPESPQFWLFNSYSASHDNWCTETLLNRVITAQCEGMGEVGSARYESALLPPCPSIRALCYSHPITPAV